MFRKLLLPIAATALLAGCVTSAPYGYRNGAQGDYYYGSPSTEYRYRGSYPSYGYGYGSPYYGPYRSGISIYGTFGSRGYSPYYGGYGYPYGYGGGYPYGYRGGYPYGYPYGYNHGHPHGHPYSQPRPVYRPRPDGGTTNRPEGGPWRNLHDLTRRRALTEGNPGAPAPSLPQLTRQDSGSMAPRARSSDEGSGMGELVRRRRASAVDE